MYYLCSSYDVGFRATSNRVANACRIPLANLDVLKYASKGEDHLGESNVGGVITMTEINVQECQQVERSTINKSQGTDLNVT